MDTYMVTLADRQTGREQRLQVQASRTDDMQEWIDSHPVGVRGESIHLDEPVVIGIRKLHIKRPLRGTLMADIPKVAV